MLGQVGSYGLLRPYEADRHDRLALWDFFWAPVFAVSGISGVVFRNLHGILWWWPLCLPVVAFHSLLLRLNRKAYLAYRVPVVAFLRSWWALLNAPAWAPFLHLKSTTEPDTQLARFIKLMVGILSVNTLAFSPLAHPLPLRVEVPLTVVTALAHAWWQQPALVALLQWEAIMPLALSLHAALDAAVMWLLYALAGPMGTPAVCTPCPLLELSLFVQLAGGCVLPVYVSVVREAHSSQAWLRRLAARLISAAPAHVRAALLSPAALAADDDRDCPPPADAPWRRTRPPAHTNAGAGARRRGASASASGSAPDTWREPPPPPPDPAAEWLQGQVLAMAPAATPEQLWRLQAQLPAVFVDSFLVPPMPLWGRVLLSTAIHLLCFPLALAFLWLVVRLAVLSMALAAPGWGGMWERQRGGVPGAFCAAGPSSAPPEPWY